MNEQEQMDEQETAAVLKFPNDHPNAELRGAEYRHKTWGELADELAERLVKDQAGGDPTKAAYARDMLTILAIAQGAADKEHPEAVVLTGQAAQDYEIRQAEMKLAALRKARGLAA